MTVRVEVEVEVRGNQGKIHLFPSMTCCPVHFYAAWLKWMEQFRLYMCSWTINIWTTMVWLQTDCYYLLWGDDTVTEVKVSTVSFDKRIFFHHINILISTAPLLLLMLPSMFGYIFCIVFQLESVSVSLWQNVPEAPIVVGTISEAVMRTLPGVYNTMDWSQLNIVGKVWDISMF